MNRQESGLLLRLYSTQAFTGLPHRRSRDRSAGRYSVGTQVVTIKLSPHAEYSCSSADDFSEAIAAAHASRHSM
jgi:hypothetical protein